MGLTQSLGSLANEGLLTALLVFAEHLEREGKVRLQDDHDDEDEDHHDDDDLDDDDDDDDDTWTPVGKSIFDMIRYNKLSW